MDPLATSDSRTPLGEPMSLLAGFLLTTDPVSWHLQYWLNIEVVGVLRGEDVTLMAVRVENELRSIERAQIRDGVQRAWGDFHRNNTEKYLEEWLHRTLASEEAQPFLRDIDRMLVDKEQKTRDYVAEMELDLVDWHRRAQAEMAEKLTKISLLYRRLAEENIADQERVRRLQATNEMEIAELRDRVDGANDVHEQEGETPAATEVEVEEAGTQPLHEVNEVHDQEEETPAATEVAGAGAENQPLHGENEVQNQEEETPAATEVDAAGAENQPLHGENEVQDQEEETPAATEVDAAGAENQPLHGENEVHDQEEETPAAPEVAAAGARNQLLDAAHYEEERAAEEEEWRQLQQEIDDFNVFADIEG
ncbi:hypothetical protein MMC29_003031, partial [Sticta canariensis]|nr:hypothetical protein [Sticta canariensis]